MNCLDCGGEGSSLIAAGGSDPVLRVWDPRKPGKHIKHYVLYSSVGNTFKLAHMFSFEQEQQLLFSSSLHTQAGSPPANGIQVPGFI